MTIESAAAPPRISPPRISFVVPAYNEERLLPACLAAIRAEIDRTGCPAEILVVDNASTGGTAAVAAATPSPSMGRTPTWRATRARWATWCSPSR